MNKKIDNAYENSAALYGVEREGEGQGQGDTGNHRLDIDASDLPSGMYLVMLDVGDRREVIRAVLMR